MRYIFDQYVNKNNIDLLCELYGFQSPKGVTLHYEIK